MPSRCAALRRAIAFLSTRPRKLSGPGSSSQPRVMTRIDPTRPTPVARSLIAAPGLADISPWPLAYKTNWSDVRTDGAVHRTWWIAEWPRLNVTAAWMDSLLSVRAATRTVAPRGDSRTTYRCAPCIRGSGRPKCARARRCRSRKVRRSGSGQSVSVSFNTPIVVPPVA